MDPVIWDDSRLGSHVSIGARVSSLGVVLDPQGTALSASLAGQFNPKVTAGTTKSPEFQLQQRGYLLAIPHPVCTTGGKRVSNRFLR